jgi:hypothetical protein
MFDPRFPLEGLQSLKGPSAKIRDRQDLTGTLN